MADIEGLGFPLVYKAHESPGGGTPANSDTVDIRTAVRSLTGMQKEALVQDGASGVTWRLVSDEGPYLNGTDLAPFPLAFYTAGMAFSFSEAFLEKTRAAGVRIGGYQLTQDNYYTMEGSAIRGDMIGGALPVEMAVEVESDAPLEVIERLAESAASVSPAQTYMTDVLANTFSLSHNGRPVVVEDVKGSPVDLHDDPLPSFEAARPLAEETYLPEIITKQVAAQPVFGVEGGAGSSLQATQKRTLHVRGVCTLSDDGLKEIKVQLFKPLGSSFHFLGDDSGMCRAPSALVYLAAGIGFCFMTQIGRYAHITKQDLHTYCIVQDTAYRISKTSAVAEPVDTHTFLQTGASEEAAQRTLAMSERTCFLHAAMRNSNKTRITVRLTTPAQTEVAF